MINVTFALNRRREDTPETERPIQCQVRYVVNGENVRLNFATGQTCKIRYFKSQRVYHTANFATQINGRLNEIRERAERLYRDAVERGKFPVKEKFKEQVLSGTYHVEVERDLLQDLDAFIEYHQSKGTSKGSLSHVVTLRGHLQQFAKKQRTTLTYECINLAFYGKFLRHLQDHTHCYGEKYEVNTIGNFIKKLKMFLHWSKGNGWNPYDYYQHPEFKTPAKRVENVYLEQNELDALAALDLTRRANLNHVRHWFLLACETGMRYSDYDQLKKRNLKEVPNGYDFVYEPHKTRKSSNVSVTVPLSMAAINILLRYGFEMPTPFSNQRMNKALKELAQLAGITKVVGTHTARRTFATLRYKEGFVVQAIMKITGHTTEKEFYKYLCIQGEENAEMFRQASKKYHIGATGLLETKLRVA